MVNEQAVCILLECILVECIITVSCPKKFMHLVSFQIAVFHMWKKHKKIIIDQLILLNPHFEIECDPKKFFASKV